MAERSEPELHSIASARMIVSESDLASAVGLEPGDDFPPVFATARMVALMELAAARLLRPHLQEGESSVGVAVNVTHTAPTPVGATVTATARFIGREGKLFVFEVSVSDGSGEVGSGTNKRAIVTTARLVAGAMKRR